MKKLDRRDFLKTSSLASVSVLSGGKGWSLTTLEPISDTLKTDYPYRSWEDVYRNEYEQNVVGYAAHCVNCHGNCAFKIIGRDGIVVREEQLARYPQISPNIPDTNPRGCQKGAIHSQAMYDPDRIRYPMKRAGARGEGKWQRISWDQALEEIADKIIDMYEEFGPGCLQTHVGTGALTFSKFSSSLRFGSLIGGIHDDGMTDVGDGHAGQHLALGDPLENPTSDTWFDADYILMSFLNVNVTRIPDAHYMWEAKYNGARVVHVSPDYSATSIHADRWINVIPGSDPFLYMGMVHTILREGLVDWQFIKEQTDLTLLVREDNKKLLRQSDLVDEGKDDIFYQWDTASGRAVEAPGSMGSETKTIALGNVDPALEGTFTIQGISVQPSFVHMRLEAMKFSPESVRDIVGVHPDIIKEEARLFATANKAIVTSGFGAAKVLNAIYNQWAQILLCSLTGHQGETGGFSSPWNSLGWEALFHLGLTSTGKPIRFQAGGLGEYVHGKNIIEAKAHFNNQKLKERTGFDIEQFEAILNEVVETGQMPVHYPRGAILSADNKFQRNKGPHYRERLLEAYSELLVNINIRMDSTAMFSDYVLPAAGDYECWDIRTSALHRFANMFTGSVKPLGESKEEWEIYTSLAKKIQERSIARGISVYDDPDYNCTRDFHTLYDDFTMGGRLVTARDTVRWFFENQPSVDVTFDEAVETGFFSINDSPLLTTTKISPNRPVVPWKIQTEDKKPYPTLSGRITFYCDHDWYMEFKSTVPTARLNAGPAASDYPYTFYTPHTRWGIHSTWRSNKYMMRQQRGEPFVYISPAMGENKGIADGEQLRVFNGIGEFYAQAKITPNVRDDQVMMEHAWEPHQFRHKTALNDINAVLLQPLEMATNWGHLTFQMFRWNPNMLANESSVDIERVDQAW